MSSTLLLTLRNARAGNTLRFNIDKFAIVAKVQKREYNISTPSNASLKTDSNTVLSSPFPNVRGYEKVLLHEKIYENIDRWIDKDALICSVTGKTFTYGELRKLSGKLAASLRKCKLHQHDTIAVVLPNIPEYAIIILAASEAGLRVTLLNPAYTSAEIKKQLENSEAKAVITVPQKYPDVKKSIEGNRNIVLPIIAVNDGSGPLPSDTIKFEDLIKDDIEPFSEKIKIDPEDTIILPFSSGTTGLPKGVDLSHRNLVANLTQMTSEGIFSGIETTATQQDVVPGVLPLFHIYGLSVIALQFLSQGAKIVCLPRFSVGEFAKLLEKYRPTMLHLAPPLLQLMTYDDNFKSRHAESMRFIMSGAAPLGEESIAVFRKRIHPTVRIVQGYGLTETSPVITLSKDAPSEASGYVLPNTQLRIVSTSDAHRTTNLSMNEVGEIQVRGPQVMKGYYKNPQATAETMDGDWFKTGDLGCFDDMGLLYIKGRLKELIKVKGFQVPPAELEEVIRGFDKVEDVAVVGVNHEKYGEIPKAFVVPKKGMKIDEGEVKNFVAERVAKYKHLGYVQFINKIPKSAAGKILRKDLQNM